MTSVPSSLFLHGGNLDEAARYYGHHLEDMTDLSTGISPLSYPLASDQFKSADWQALPRKTEEDNLIAVARRAYNVVQTAELCLGSGSQSLLQAAARLMESACTVWIPAPTYSEHGRVWQQAGHKVVTSADMPCDARCAVIVNPNNPDGRVYEREMLLQLADELSQKGGFLLLDEAFIDCNPALSLMASADVKGLVILRSLGKFFGLAGLRVGFATGHKDIITSLRHQIGPWPLATPSITAATYALNDEKWAHMHRRELAVLLDRMQQILAASQIKIIGRTGLFITVSDPDARALHAVLAGQAIWVRAFEYEPEWLRFGLTADETVFRKVTACLIKWRRQTKD